MFNNTPNWTPYVIPPCPDVSGDDIFSLSCEEGASSDKNPSKFLKWKRGLPKGQKSGDLLQWDPSAGDGGGWIVLAVPSYEGSIIYWNGSAWQFLTPPSGNVLHVLGIQGGTLAWTATEDCG